MEQKKSKKPLLIAANERIAAANERSEDAK